MEAQQYDGGEEDENVYGKKQPNN